MLAFFIDFLIFIPYRTPMVSLTLLLVLVAALGFASRPRRIQPPLATLDEHLVANASPSAAVTPPAGMRLLKRILRFFVRGTSPPPRPPRPG